MGVLTNDYFCFSLLISLLMAKVIPAGDTIDTQDILFLLHNLSSGSPFMLLLLPLCNITGYAIRSAKSRHRPVMTDDMLMWSRSGTATPR